MEFKLLFFAYLALCAVAFVEVLITVRKNNLLKIYLLLIISSLFVMNYFSYVSVSTRLQFVLVKGMRFVYVCSTMLTLIHLVTPKIPRWIIVFSVGAAIFMIGFRLFYFDEIILDGSHLDGRQIFSFGAELTVPHKVIRYAAFLLAASGAAITFHYYRKLFMKLNIEDTEYKRLSIWIVCMALPVFLLIIFGILGILKLFPANAAPYLFSVFSCIILVSVLLRPKLLNKNSSLRDGNLLSAGNTR